MMVTEEQNRKACQSKQKAKDIIAILEDKDYVFMSSELKKMSHLIIDRMI